MSDAAVEHVRAALHALGLDVDPEMRNTAASWVDLLREFQPEPIPPELRALPTSSRSPIVLRALPYHSLCAHHLVPFFGHAVVAYLPEDRIVGLGGIPRMLRHHARRPQLQERLADELAGALEQAVAPQGVLVRISARQMCMEMRGPATSGEVWVEAARGDVDLLRALIGPIPA